MTRLNIRKGKRRPFLFISIPRLINRNRSFSICKKFLFTDSAIYQFSDEDQWDVNKLFGFSLGFHHVNSFRFGWRPTKDLTSIEIVGYEYRNKIRFPTVEVCNVQLDKWYTYTIKYSANKNIIQYIVTEAFGSYVGIISITKADFPNERSWSYRLGLYFGGNKVAPHDIRIDEQ